MASVRVSVKIGGQGADCGRRAGAGLGAAGYSRQARETVAAGADRGAGLAPPTLSELRRTRRGQLQQEHVRDAEGLTHMSWRRDAVCGGGG